LQHRGRATVRLGEQRLGRRLPAAHVPHRQVVDPLREQGRNQRRGRADPHHAAATPQAAHGGDQTSAEADIANWNTALGLLRADEVFVQLAEPGTAPAAAGAAAVAFSGAPARPGRPAR
jgi:hypothetical protein